MSRPSIRLIVALPAEAKPVNRHFGLQRDNRVAAYPLYRNDPITLVVCGPGKQQAAGAVTWLEAQHPSQGDAIWINLGIAGHRSAPIGAPLLAATVSDEIDGACLSAHPPGGAEYQEAPLISVERPRFDYPKEALFDMEGYGFFQAARTIAPIKQVQCLKVVSDNPDHPAQNINGKMVRQLIADNLDTLQALIDTLEEQR